MAKRFTDTNKWSRKEFHSLPVKMKLAWLYMNDNCDHAGIWDMNIELMSFLIGIKISVEDMVKYFGEMIEIRGNSLRLIPFIEYQYGELNPDNKVHLSVINKLKLFSNISKNSADIKPLASPLQGAKDKERDIYKEKEREAPCGFDFLEPSVNDWLCKVSQELKKRWLLNYSKPYLRREINKAYEWNLGQSKKKKNIGSFLGSWLERSKDGDVEKASEKLIAVMGGLPDETDIPWDQQQKINM